MEKIIKVDSQTRECISNAREIMESFDPGPAMTIGYDLPEYTLTAEQMSKIMSALYLADCLVYEIDNSESDNS